MLADGYEMKDCITQCLESVGEDLTFETAIAVLDDVPPQLQQHAAMGKLKEPICDALAKGFDGCNDEGLLRRAGDALATCLGPVH